MSHPIVDLFRERFGAAPSWAASAPGRVNLIGEHTDYNDGLVLPIAIDRSTTIAASPADDPGAFNLHSTEAGDATCCADDDPSTWPAWARYVMGVLLLCRDVGYETPGLNILIDSDVPAGGGLSSSAALEVATATLVEAACGRAMEPAGKALLCQKAEHDFAGVPCGIMDQFVSAMGRSGQAMLLDCRDRSMRFIGLDADEVSVIVANTMVSHELADGAYAQRRAQCAAAAAALGLESLRDASPADLPAVADVCGPEVERRTRHVVSEIERTAATAEAMAAGQWATAGELMTASHASLRDDYAVSCDELDLMVALATRLGGPRVFGSRMTGGGFGGCTVSLVRTKDAGAVARTLAAAYNRETGLNPQVFVVRPSDGCRVLEVDA